MLTSPAQLRPEVKAALDAVVCRYYQEYPSSDEETDDWILVDDEALLLNETYDLLGWDEEAQRLWKHFGSKPVLTELDPLISFLLKKEGDTELAQTIAQILRKDASSKYLPLVWYGKYQINESLASKAELWSLLAIELAHIKENEYAKQSLDIALQAYQTEDTAYQQHFSRRRIGQALGALGNMSEAKRFLRVTDSTSADLDEALEEEVCFLLREGRFPEAIEQAKNLVRHVDKRENRQKWNYKLTSLTSRFILVDVAIHLAKHNDRLTAASLLLPLLDEWNLGGQSYSLLIKIGTGFAEIGNTQEALKAFRTVYENCIPDVQVGNGWVCVVHEALQAQARVGLAYATM